MDYPAPIAPIGKKVAPKRLTRRSSCSRVRHEEGPARRSSIAPAPDARHRGQSSWVSWPKKAAGIASEITEDTVRDMALPPGYVDVKVSAVDNTWSGLNSIVRKTLR